MSLLIYRYGCCLWPYAAPELRPFWASGESVLKSIRMLYAKRNRLGGIFNLVAVLGLLCIAVLGLAVFLPRGLSLFWEIFIALAAFAGATVVSITARGALGFERKERFFLIGILAASLILYIAML